ncbi:MBL fold metallo-hydrolase [soil metagenome]
MAVLLSEEEQSRIALGEREEARVVVARPDADAAREPERAQAVAVSGAELASVHTAILVAMRIGRYEVDIFSDGTFKLDGGSMVGVVPNVLWQRHKPADDRNRVEMDMSCLLIRDVDGHVVVVETGAGSKLTEPQRSIYGIERPPALVEELGRRGVRPEDVTLVINTHLHFDHSGGNTYRRDGELVASFPRASYVFQRLEWNDAIRPNERTRGSYFADDFVPLEAAGKLELVEDSVELLPGLRVDRVQGHTRGTQTVRVSDGGETLFFSSDFMPDRHHLPLPWIPAFDLFPLDTLEAKRAIIARALEERWIVAFTHDLPRFGRLEEIDMTVRFTELG